MGSIITDVLTLVFQAQVPNLLILAGLVCFGLAILGKFERVGFRLTRSERIFATIIGGLLLFLGLHLLTSSIPSIKEAQISEEQQRSPSPTPAKSFIPTPTPDTTETRTFAQSPTPESSSTTSSKSHRLSNRFLPPPLPETGSLQKTDAFASPKPKPPVSSKTTPASYFKVWGGNWSTSIQDQYGATHTEIPLRIIVEINSSNKAHATGEFNGGLGKLNGEIIAESDGSGELLALKFKGTSKSSDTNPQYPLPCYDASFIFDLDYKSNPPKFNGNYELCPSTIKEMVESDPKWEGRQWTGQFRWDGTKKG